MTTTVGHDNMATIPKDIADAFGIKEGTRLEWSDAGAETIVVKPLPSRGARAKTLMGAGRRWLKAGQDPIGELIRERGIPARCGSR